MEISPQERALLRQVQRELAQILRDSDKPRPDTLEAAGIRESTFDSAWSRGSIKLAWILRLLVAQDVDPKVFFHRAYGGGSLRPDSSPPRISKLARRLKP